LPPASLRKIKRTTLTDSVIEQLLEMIQDGALLSGQRLPSEHELMSTMGVGRTPVREALRALALADLIEIRPGYGSTVKRVELTAPEPIEKASSAIRTTTLHHLSEARQMLEGEIAAAAAERASEDDIAEMDDILSRCERAIDHHQTPHKLAAYFHMAIAESTRNTVLIRLIHSILDLMVEGGRQRHVAGYMRWELDSHREVLSAIRTKDPNLARETMRRHIAEASARYALKDRADSSQGQIRIKGGPGLFSRPETQNGPIAEGQLD
jgi:GntR family transcriptional regulator, transcriptional repressor for pyruvate dehydrogenase complex